MSKPKPGKQSQPTEPEHRIFIPGREFASAREFADFIREAEVVRISGTVIFL